jgi:predicted hotdog family 3-hydroxylacyl-ACP dehydratase
VSLDRSWIEQHVPQQGAMCLLDEVLSWDRQHVLCRSGAHQRIDHPLRAYDRLGSACAIEYAAQAAAVHGALIAREEALAMAAPDRGASSRPRFGMLASARAVELAVARLDGVSGALLVRVSCLHADTDSALYDFTVSEEGHGAAAGADAASPLARGRLSLWLNAAATRFGTP